MNTDSENQFIEYTDSDNQSIKYTDSDNQSIQYTDSDNQSIQYKKTVALQKPSGNQDHMISCHDDVFGLSYTP